MATMNKPALVEKMSKFVRQLRQNGNQIGNIPRSLALDYNNLCNFKCDFCYERGETKYNKEHLSLDEISRIADEASDLGIWEIVLQGGELLINVDVLIDIIKAFQPERFRMVLVTNGYFLSSDVATRLAQSGLDCVGVSVSSLNAEEHDRSRHLGGAHVKALEALENARNAGMVAWAQPIFGHHNSRSLELYEFLDYLKEKNFGIYFLLAMPYGIWKDNYLDTEDIRIFNEIRKNYNCSFDTWDLYDRKKERISGCWAVNRLFITPLGDVLPCPFINIKIGNIKEQSLQEIVDYGFSIKYFGETSPICLAGQNKKFRDKYLNGSTSMFEPMLASEVFDNEDFIDKNKEKLEE